MSVKFQDEKLKNKSHLFIQFEVLKTSIDSNQFSNKQTNRLNFVRLADLEEFNSLVDEENDFKILQKFISQLKNGKICTIYKACNLTFSLWDTMNDKTQWKIVNCIASDNINNGEIALKFISLGDKSPILTKKIKDNQLMKVSLSPQNQRLIQNSDYKSSKSVKNKMLESLAQELEHFINELSSQGMSYQRLSERDKFEFVSQKEGLISEFSKHLDQHSIGANSANIQLCEQLLFKAQKQLRKITSPQFDPNGDDVERLMARESRLRGLQRERQESPVKVFNSINAGNNSMSNFQQGNNNKLEEIKQREEQVEKDFVKLLTRYNQSKNLIESLCVNSTNESRRSPRPKSELPDLQPGTSKSSLQNSKYNYDEVSLNGQQQQSISKEYTNNKDVRFDNDKNISKSLKRLKQTITMKEAIEKDKLEIQRQATKELRRTLKEYVQRNHEMEEALRNKDELIDKYEVEIKSCQEDLMMNLDKMKEYKIKEEGWVKLEEELREQSLNLKGKAQRKKQKIRDLRQQNEEVARTLEEFRDEHERECKKLRQVAEELSGSLQQKEIRIQDLEEQIRIMNEREIERNHSHSHSRENLEKKIEDLKDLQAQLEAKINKNKSKYEEEKRNWAEDKTQEVEKKKEKIIHLKRVNQELTDSLSNQDKKILQLESTLDNTRNQLKDTEKLVEEFKNENKKLLLDLSGQRDTIIQSQKENDKLTFSCGSLQDELRKRENELEREMISNQQLRGDIQKFQDEKLTLTETISRLESQIEFLEQKQASDLNEIEEKIEKMIEETRLLKDENAELKQKEINYRRQINQMDEVQNSYKEKYLKAKNNNKTLKEHLKDVEDKVKEYMHERTIDQRDQERMREQVKTQEHQTKTKLKLLDEIQSMIKQHKNHIQRID